MGIRNLTTACDTPHLPRSVERRRNIYQVAKNCRHQRRKMIEKIYGRHLTNNIDASAAPSQGAAQAESLAKRPSNRRRKPPRRLWVARGSALRY